MGIFDLAKAVVGVVIETPLAVCRKRAHASNRADLLPVIARMHQHTELPVPAAMTVHTYDPLREGRYGL